MVWQWTCSFLLGHRINNLPVLANKWRNEGHRTFWLQCNCWKPEKLGAPMQLSPVTFKPHVGSKLYGDRQLIEEVFVFWWWVGINKTGKNWVCLFWKFGSTSWYSYPSSWVSLFSSPVCLTMHWFCKEKFIFDHSTSCCQVFVLE